ncbi:hypothetical protein K439DRAFT_1630406 [Ramaria rubella]|nr:hypothetical protein K439DRAFT_1630406 [Ramaria rubella]
MSSPIYYHTDGSPYAAATIPLPPSPYGSPYSSPYGSPYGVHLVPLPPSPVSPFNIPLPRTPTHNPLPLPPVISGPVTTSSLAAGTAFTAHPLLEFDPEDPGIAWDARLPPDSIRLSKPPFRVLTPHHLNQPAVSPPWTFVRLRCALLPWLVECANPTGVTVGDVLDGVYDALRERVDRDEWRESSSEFQGRLLDSWERRCIMAGEDGGRAARIKEEKRGIRRVDWLLWDIEWLGIERSKDELETWVMHFRSR